MDYGIGIQGSQQSKDKYSEELRDNKSETEARNSKEKTEIEEI